jgi:hypothetical protein
VGEGTELKNTLIIAAAALGCVLLPNGYANSLCTSFTPTILHPGTLSFVQAGPVCTVDGITLSDLNYTFDYNAQTNNPGTISINVVDTTPYQYKLVFTSANGWIQNGGANTNADFSVLYKLSPGGLTTNPWPPPATYLPEIVSAQMKTVGDTGWDPATNPVAGDFTGEVQGTDAFTAVGYPLMNSNIPNQDPSLVNSGGCLATYTCNPFSVVGALVPYTTPPIGKFTSAPSISAEKDMLMEGGSHVGDYAKITRVDQIYNLLPVPEPMSLMLIGGGLVGIAVLTKKKARLS